MGKYLIYSFVLHLVALGAGAFVAPLSGIFGSNYRPTQIIPVTMVDFPEARKSAPVPVPKLPAPEPVGDAAVAIAPEKDLTLEKVPEKPKPEPPKEDDTKEDDDKAADKEGTGEDEKLAQADTASEVTGSLREGGGDDIWGVEVAANINPYYKRGYSQIRSNWRNPVVGAIPRKCTVRFRVGRNGEISDIELERSSGLAMFDNSCLRAVRYTGTWEPFPSFWEEDEQIIHLEFEYRPN